ncbi:glutathione S-transferase [Rhodoferax sp. PAMC 29310]|uniref:glutathione S-transferase n=1 Tax=Rhodoferax sp. PAMC 29310 TaxID=2822760 RepID=UPI001B33F1D3|nr:glutathione S-transferase [Rhodoferax sp. PAMC 29310]
MINSAPCPVLYSFRRCPYAMRARLALLASGQRCELREVVLRDKPAALLAVSSKATVPVLVTPEGQVIEQSLEIMLWTLRQNDPLAWLGEGESLLAPSLGLIQRCDGDFKHHLDRYKYPHRYDLPDGLAHRTLACEFLNDLNTRIQANGQLLRQTPCLADMAIAPFVRQFAHTDPGWFAAQPLSALQAWLIEFEASALFLRAMPKFAPWEPEQAPVIFPDNNLLSIR